MEPAEAAPAPGQVIRRQVTLADAIAFAKPQMTDTFNDQSAGTNLLGLWSIDKLTWADLNALTATKPSLVMKDPVKVAFTSTVEKYRARKARWSNPRGAGWG